MNINLNQKRQQLLCDKPGPCAAVVFSGRAPMRSADGAYPFSVDRDFYYLTGIDHENMILVMTKDHYGKTSEMLFIEPYDEVQAKWVGGRMKPDEATAISGVQDIRYLDTFESALNLMIRANRGEGEMNLWLDLWKHTRSRSRPWHTSWQTRCSRNIRQFESTTSSATLRGCVPSRAMKKSKR